jgi:hypothetical protein
MSISTPSLMKKLDLDPVVRPPALIVVVFGTEGLRGKDELQVVLILAGKSRAVPFLSYAQKKRWCCE